MADELTHTALLEEGWAALAEGDWEPAKALFEKALVERETPEALEGIGWAGHMLNDYRLTLDAREHAYRLYLDRSDRSSAARIAAWLAADSLLFRGEAAVANGWLQRAHSLIDGLEPGVDHGWVAFHEGHIAIALDEAVSQKRLKRGDLALLVVFGAGLTWAAAVIEW